MKLYCCYYYYYIYISSRTKEERARVFLPLSLVISLSRLLFRIRQLQILEQLPFIPTLPHAIEAFVDHFLPD